jgi:hypothetical protein
VAAKRKRLAARGPLRGFVGTVSHAIDLIGQYQEAGVQLLINSDYPNETNELLASDIIPRFRSAGKETLPSGIDPGRCQPKSQQLRLCVFHSRGQCALIRERVG